jgi:hypothetical protein
MGIDFGDVHPCAVVLGGVIQNRHGTLCVCWYFLEGWENTTGHALPNPLFEVQLARLAKKHGVQMSYADPSRSSLILGNQALGRRTGNLGLANNIAGFNNIIDGITQVHSLIFQKLLLFPVGTQGAIRVHETPDDPGVITPQKAYEYLSAYHWATDKNGISTEEPADGQFSHCCDSTRYALAKRTGT